MYRASGAEDPERAVAAASERFRMPSKCHQTDCSIGPRFALSWGRVIAEVCVCVRGMTRSTGRRGTSAPLIKDPARYKVCARAPLKLPTRARVKAARPPVSCCCAWGVLRGGRRMRVGWGMV